MADLIDIVLKDGRPARVPADVTPQELEQIGGRRLPSTADTVAGTLMSGVQGATGGLLDEAAAGLRAAFPSFTQRDSVMDRMRPADVAPDSGRYRLAPADPNLPIGERYDAELAKVRKPLHEFQQESPVLDTLGKIGGGVATIGMAAPKAMFVGPTMGNTTVRSALSGSALGGGAGFAEGEGGLKNRAWNAAPGAVAGAGIGAVAPPVAGAVGGLAREYGPRLAGKLGDAIAWAGDKMAGNQAGKAAGELAGATEAGAPTVIGQKGGYTFSVPNGPPPPIATAVPRDAPQLGRVAPQAPPDPNMLQRIGQSAQAVRERAPANAALHRLAQALDEAGATPEQAQAELARLGSGATLADVNTAIRDLATNGYTMPGPARTVYETNFRARRNAAPDRMEAAGRENIADTDSYALAFKQMQEARAKLSEKLFGEADAAGLNVTPELKGMLDSPIVKRELAKLNATRASVGEGGGPPRLAEASAGPLEPTTTNAIKRALNQRAHRLYKSGHTDEANTIDEFATKFRDELYKANTKLGEANAAHEAMSKNMEYMEKGRTFMRQGANATADAVDSRVLATELENATPELRHAFRYGMGDAWRTEVRRGVDQSRAIARNLPGSRELMDRLRVTAGPDKAAALADRATIEAERYAPTENKILGGSDTASKTASEAKEAGAKIAETLGKVGEAFDNPTGSVANIAKWLAKQAIGYTPKHGEDVRYELAKLLSQHAEAAANQKTLDSVRLLMEAQKRAAPKAGRAGVPTGTEAVAPFELGKDR